jgi:hypothetical protein
MDTPECCGEKTLKVITRAPMGVVRGRFEPFKSPVDGSIISSIRDMAEHNKRNNVVSLADGYTDEVVRSGNFGEKPKADPKDLKQDVVESFKMVSSGYTPERRSEDAA